ncbi:MAG TPA: hypothetical protein VK968_15760 [Roseimicrobium sp.]|nr:hypothetical protein [Roseimicrobium sp.]
MNNMPINVDVPAQALPGGRSRPGTLPQLPETAFGCARDFWGQQYVYTVISPRARGLSVGINLNPDRYCNFDCVYCEVNRDAASGSKTVDLNILADELEATLQNCGTGRLRERPCYRNVPDELLQLRHITLSGDGEPTLCDQFEDILRIAVHRRALRPQSFLKLVLITNTAGLDRPAVQSALRLMTPQDEIWAKLDAGSQEDMDRINRTSMRLETVLKNILEVSRQRPVIIQSLFSAIDGEKPAEQQINSYVERLASLKSDGANIPLVQIYSPTRPTPGSTCTHLPLRTLSEIARRVREETGLRAEVF